MTLQQQRPAHQPQHLQLPSLDLSMYLSWPVPGALSTARQSRLLRSARRTLGAAAAAAVTGERQAEGRGERGEVAFVGEAEGRGERPAGGSDGKDGAAAPVAGGVAAGEGGAAAAGDQQPVCTEVSDVEGGQGGALVKGGSAHAGDVDPPGCQLQHADGEQTEQGEGGYKQADACTSARVSLCDATTQFNRRSNGGRHQAPPPMPQQADATTSSSAPEQTAGKSEGPQQEPEAAALCTLGELHHLIQAHAQALTQLQQHADAAALASAAAAMRAFGLQALRLLRNAAGDAQAGPQPLAVAPSNEEDAGQRRSNEDPGAAVAPKAAQAQVQPQALAHSASSVSSKSTLRSEGSEVVFIEGEVEETLELLQQVLVFSRRASLIVEGAYGEPLTAEQMAGISFVAPPEQQKLAAQLASMAKGQQAQAQQAQQARGQQDQQAQAQQARPQAQQPRAQAQQARGQQAHVQQRGKAPDSALLQANAQAQAHAQAQTHAPVQTHAPAQPALGVVTEESSTALEGERAGEGEGEGKEEEEAETAAAGVADDASGGGGVAAEHCSGDRNAEEGFNGEEGAAGEHAIVTGPAGAQVHQHGEDVGDGQHDKPTLNAEGDIGVGALQPTEGEQGEGPEPAVGAEGFKVTQAVERGVEGAPESGRMPAVMVMGAIETLSAAVADGGDQQAGPGPVMECIEEASPSSDAPPGDTPRDDAGGAPDEGPHASYVLSQGVDHLGVVGEWFEAVPVAADGRLRVEADEKLRAAAGKVSHPEGPEERPEEAVPAGKAMENVPGQGVSSAGGLAPGPAGRGMAAGAGASSLGGGLHALQPLQPILLDEGQGGGATAALNAALSESGASSPASWQLPSPGSQLGSAGRLDGSGGSAQRSGSCSAASSPTGTQAAAAAARAAGLGASGMSSRAGSEAGSGSSSFRSHQQGAAAARRRSSRQHHNAHDAAALLGVQRPQMHTRRRTRQLQPDDPVLEAVEKLEYM